MTTSTEEKTIVLTGATSGVGAAALDILVQQSDAPIIVGARRPELMTERYGSRITTYPLDLDSLENVQAFCRQLDGISIGALALNAGIMLTKFATTKDGLERTFQVNYLSHFLMFQLLKSQLTEHAKVVITSSSTHDPADEKILPTPRNANAEWLAYPDRATSRIKKESRAASAAYTASKLCCTLMAMAIATHHPNLRSVSFDPGYLPDTKLNRDYNPILMALVSLIAKVVVKDDRLGSLKTTAPIFADLVTGKRLPSENGGYISMRNGEGLDWPPSELAQTPGLAQTLWNESLSLLRDKIQTEL